MCHSNFFRVGLESIFRDHLSHEGNFADPQFELITIQNDGIVFERRFQVVVVFFTILSMGDYIVCNPDNSCQTFIIETSCVL